MTRQKRARDRRRLGWIVAAIGMLACGQRDSEGDDASAYPLLSASCGPADGAQLVLTIYGDGSFDGCDVSADAIVELQLIFDDVGEDGEYEFSASSGGGFGTHRGGGGVIEDVLEARLVLDELGGGTASGSYEVAVRDGGELRLIAGTLTDIPACASAGPCG